MESTSLDANLLKARLSKRLIGCQVLFYKTLGSTMDEARRLADTGGPEGTVVVTEAQTAGRGRLGRSWISPPEQDLLFSVILRPSAAKLRYVNMAATLAVFRAAADATGIVPAIKWPNDVRIKGRKVAGILVETAFEGQELSYAVVGIGLNVNLDSAQVPEIAASATSLYKETGGRWDRTAILLAVLEQLDDLYAAVTDGRSLTEEWSSQLETLGCHVQVRWQNRLLEGLARGVDEQGNLVLALTDGSTVTVVAGEVNTEGSGDYRQ